MSTIHSVSRELGAAQQRLNGLKALPVKSEIDHQLIADLQEYIADLFENLGELTREQATDRHFAGGEE